MPQGFPSKDRIENAASVRLTKAGVGFVNDNLSALVGQFGGDLLKGGVLQQAIPQTSTKVNILVGNVTVNVCENTPDPNHPNWCLVEADIGKSNLKLSPTAPNELILDGDLLARVAFVPIRAPTFLGDIKAHVTLSENDTCDENAAQFAKLPLNLHVPIVADTNPQHGSRTGLSRVGKLKLDLKIDDNKIHICGDNFGGTIISFLAGFFKSTLVDQLTGPLQDQLDQALCIKGDPNVSPPCPVGSSPEDPNDLGSKCVFDDNKDECASFALGTEGTVNLSNALSAFSPTTTGGLDFLFSVGGLGANPNNNGQPLGDLAPVNEGATLSLTGGANANPLSKCVNPAVLQKPANIPTPKLLLGNDVPGWPAVGPAQPPPHFGLAISQDFANYALGGIYNSGLLCLQIGTEQVAQLNSNALGLLISSFKTLPLQKQNAPVGLILKPTNPPKATFGNGTDPKTDPSMNIDLKGLGIDFYVWSSDRYIRAFSSSFDLGVPVNLAVSKEGLTPQIADPVLSNAKVTNSELLSEKPEAIADGVKSLLGAAVGQALGGINPIDLSSALASLGFALNIPASEPGKGSPGLQKVTEGGQNFLGIFASLSIASQQAQVTTTKTSAEVASRRIDPAGLRLVTVKPDNAPVLTVRAASSAAEGEKVEYTYRIDKGYWRPWSLSSEINLRDDMLRIQGKHTVYVKSRVVGHPESEGEPVAVPLTLDVDAPEVMLVRHGDKLAVRAVDHIADDEEMKVRYRIDQNAFSEWETYHDGIRIPAEEGDVTVEVKDGEENVATITQPLRGKVDNTGVTDPGGCGCAVPGQKSETPAWPLGAFGVMGVVALLRGRRRRLREAAAGLTVLAISGSWSGCSCSDSDSTTEDITTGTGGAAGDGGEGGSAGTAGKGGSGGKGGSAGSGGTSAGAGGSDPNNPCKPENDCVALNPGLVGSYTSAATAADGTIWVAGYNESDPNEGYPYGDLVVGKYDAGQNAIAWQTIDGTDPNEEVDPTAFDAQGWRGGKSEAGPDVGLWTSIAVGEGDKPVVAYYDVTNGALKFASSDGEKWSNHTVQQKAKSQIGRYAKLNMVGGKPVIAFMFYEVGQGGFAASGVRVARASKAVPTSGSDWAFEDVFVNPQTPCRATLCEKDAKCNLTSGKCEAPATCSSKCASGEECFNGANGPACQPVAATNKPEAYVNATGLYVAAALTKDKSDVGIAFYDRIRGNVYTAQKKGTWQAGIVEGQSGDNPGTDTGDVGLGASLFIDDKGDWHLAYVNGLDETLRYLVLPGGAAGGVSEVADYGGPPGSNEPAADQNLVGDDSSIRVQDGKITIAYQNATAGKLRVASRPLAGGAWTRTEVKQDGKFAGFFSQQVTSGGKKKLVNFWRVGGAKIEGNVSVLDAP